jgi:cytochrome c
VAGQCPARAAGRSAGAARPTCLCRARVSGMAVARFLPARPDLQPEGRPRMENILFSSLTAGVALLAAVGMAAPARAAVDADAAYALAKKSECFKCHAIDKKKSGTPLREVAKKYKGKSDAEDTLVKHVTTKPMVEVDGKKEEHRVVKSTDDAAIRNLVQWILAQ